MLTNKFIPRKGLSVFATVSMITVQAVIIGAASEARGSDDAFVRSYMKCKYGEDDRGVDYLIRASSRVELLTYQEELQRATELGDKYGFIDLMLEFPQHDPRIVLEAWKRHGKRALEAFRNNDDPGAAFDALARTPAPDLWDELSAVNILSDLGFDENDPEFQSAVNYLHAEYCADADDIDLENLMTALTIQRLNIDIGQRDDGAFYDLNLTLQDLGIGIDNYNEMLNQPENVELLRNLGEV